MKKQSKIKTFWQSIIIIIVILLLCFADTFAQEKQLPRIDSVNNKRVFTDQKGNKFDVYRSDNGRSYIVKDDGKRLFLFRKKETD